ncbi:MAG: alpha/beta fold hydrolase [Dehalococcoidia bacterium]|nr:MAG: alpha/beta fold hydrolase [Dehalococcoidia bacterium]
MKVRNIYLESDGIKLAGEVYVPPADKPSPALCICHGVPANTYNPADRGYAALAERFSDAGFVTLIFNFRGAGKSEGNLDMLGWTRDLRAALNFLCDLDEIDKKRICLLGFSGGAAVSVYITAHDPRISLLLACACPAHFRFLTSKEAGIATIRHFQEIEVIRDKDFPPSIEDWLKGFEEVSAIQWIDKISPRPLLLVHGDADEVVPLEHAYMLFRKANEPKEIAIIPGAKHKLRLEEKAMTTVLDWLKARC